MWSEHRKQRLGSIAEMAYKLQTAIDKWRKGGSLAIVLAPERSKRDPPGRFRSGSAIRPPCEQRLAPAPIIAVSQNRSEDGRTYLATVCTDHQPVRKQASRIPRDLR